MIFPVARAIERGRSLRSPIVERVSARGPR